jgi:hypothetical protein
MYLRFAFEDGAETLEYMAQSMRRKLDLVGVKIGLKGWQAMTRAERLALAHFPVDMDDERAAFVQVLRGFAERAGAKVGTVAAVDAVDARAWGKERVPDAVRARRDISLDAWVAKRVHWSFIIWLAGMVNVTAMLPQLVRIIRTRNIEGLSRAMVVLYFLVQVAFSIERVVRVMTMLGFCSRRLWLAVPE